MKIAVQRGSRRRRLLFCGVLGLLACGSYLVGRYGDERLQQWLTYATKGEIAEVEESALDFGETFVQEDFKWRLPIRNKSRRTLEIAGWRESCHCTAIEPDRLTIPPGEVREVAFTMNLTSAKAEAEGKPAWDFAVMVSPKIITPSFPAAAWKIHGRVRAAMVCSPGTLDFGESLVAGEPFRARCVEVASHEQLESLKAKWDHRFGAVAVRPADAERRHFRVEVTPTKDLTLGAHSFVVDLVGVDAQGKGVAKSHVYVQANVVNDMDVIPCPLSFGIGVVGRVLEQNVMLRSRRRQPFSVVSIQSAEKAVAGIETVETNPRQDDGSAVYCLRLCPLQAGVHSFQIVFRVQPTRGAPQDVPLSVCYSASLAADPSTSAGQLLRKAVAPDEPALLHTVLLQGNP